MTTNPLTQVDALECWLVLNLLSHSPDDNRLRERADDLVFRLRNEGKIEDSTGEGTR